MIRVKPADPAGPAISSQTWLQQALLRRLRDSGLDDAVATIGGGVRFGEVSWQPTPGHHVDDAWNRLVAEHLRERLEFRALRSLAPEAIWVTKDGEDGRMGVSIDGLPVGALQVSGSAVRLEGKQIGPTANYLTDGDHWRTVRDRVLAAIARSSATPTAATDGWTAPVLLSLTEEHRHMLNLPVSVTLADALFASADLLDHRTRAYALPTVLTSARFELELWPVQPLRGRPVLPFRVRAEDTVEGALVLGVASDPAPLCIRRGEYRPLVSDAWAIALVGAARLLCHPTADDTAEEEWDEDLRPTHETRQLIDTAVVGHLRTLADGWNASPQQRELARGLGIRLGPSQTWVRPHSRGLPRDAVLRFDWRSERGAGANR